MPVISRDDRRKNSVSMSGTYNNDYTLTTSTNVTHHVQTPLKVSRILENKSELTYISSTSSELSNTAEGDFEKKYPDLIEGSSYLYKGSLKAISEGNSASNLSEVFCTLPRKVGPKQNDQIRYCSTDSQFPLLSDSRYSSSGGDSSASSQISYNRNISDVRKYEPSNINRVSNKSNSYLNLSSTRQQSSPPSPIREIPSSTPLLDVNGLDNRVLYRRHIVSPSVSPVPTTIANSYDYHAAQLERFLEEYRSLQKELTKMKESCENYTKEQMSVKYFEPLFGNNCSSGSAVENKNSRSNSTQNTLLPHSPNSNHPLDNSINNLETELSKYLLTSNSATNAFSNSDLINN